MNQDELIEKCRLTDDEIWDAIETKYAAVKPSDVSDACVLVAEAQLRKAISIIQQVEREAIRAILRRGFLSWGSDGFHSSYIKLDSSSWQALKGEGDG